MCVTVTLLPQKSVASEVYTAFRQISNSETTNHNKTLDATWLKLVTTVL